jgi:hypothetical protein
VTGWNWVVIGLSVVLPGLVVWMAVLQVRLSRLRKQYGQLMRGVTGANLEEALNGHVSELQDAVRTVSTLESETRRIDRTLRHAMQWMGVVRFNPFRNTGGDQSFAWALVDGYGNGVVLTSLHARENTRVYAKPVHRWESPYSLTEEEEQALQRARDQQENDT